MFSGDNIDSEAFHPVLFLKKKKKSSGISEIRPKVTTAWDACPKGQTMGQSHISLDLLAFNEMQNVSMDNGLFNANMNKRRQCRCATGVSAREGLSGCSRGTCLLVHVNPVHWRWAQGARKQDCTALRHELSLFWSRLSSPYSLEA